MTVPDRFAEAVIALAVLAWPLTAAPILAAIF